MTTMQNESHGTPINKEMSSLVVLCVDDELNVLKSLKRTLRSAKYEVHTANSGLDGLEILSQHPVDIVISDMRMPEMDGAEFLTRVAENYPNTIRLLLTGYSDIASTITAVNKGGISNYLHKPWNQEELMLTLEQGAEKLLLERENKRLLEEISIKNKSLAELNHSLEDKVKQRTAQITTALTKLQAANAVIKNNLNATIRTFYNLIGFNPFLGGKLTIKISNLAHLLAGATCEDAQQIKDIQLAALLCELGMLGLPNEILQTPVDQLTSEQRSLYVSSATQAHLALSPAAPLKNVAYLILHQHESYSGQGGPDRLSGNDIPLGSRIIALARDYIYATSGKLFKTRMSPQGAIDYFSQNEDLRYDPDLVARLPEFVDQLDYKEVDENEKLLALSELEPRMKLSRDVLNNNNMLLLPEGHVFTEESIKRLRKFLHVESTPVEIFVQIQ